MSRDGRSLKFPNRSAKVWKNLTPPALAWCSLCHRYTFYLAFTSSACGWPRERAGDDLSEMVIPKVESLQLYAGCGYWDQRHGKRPAADSRDNVSGNDPKAAPELDFTRDATAVDGAFGVKRSWWHFCSLKHPLKSSALLQSRFTPPGTRNDRRRVPT